MYSPIATPAAAAATLLDGYPMCKKGQAGKALSVAMFSSFCGGVIGALVMTFLSPLVADMAMNFGPGEMFMLAVFGLSVIVAISGKSVAKGLISAFFGMLLCTVGLDPTNGIPRFITTKQTGLLDGFQFIPTLIGLFAVSEVIAGVERIIRGEEQEQRSNEKITNVLPDWKTIKKIWPNILSGGLIGTFIGAIPATLLILIQNPIKALWFVLFVLVLQQVDGNIIGPKILGNTTGLSSFWVLFAILLFGGLWGFAGMIVGVPLFAVIYDVIKKLVIYGLQRHQELTLLNSYHDQFGDPADDAAAQPAASQPAENQ